MFSNSGSRIARPIRAASLGTTALLTGVSLVGCSVDAYVEAPGIRGRFQTRPDRPAGGDQEISLCDIELEVGGRHYPVVDTDGDGDCDSVVLDSGEVIRVRRRGREIMSLLPPGDHDPSDPTSLEPRVIHLTWEELMNLARVDALASIGGVPAGSATELIDAAGLSKYMPGADFAASLNLHVAEFSPTDQRVALTFGWTTAAPLPDPDEFPSLTIHQFIVGPVETGAPSYLHTQLAGPIGDVARYFEAFGAEEVHLSSKDFGPLRIDLSGDTNTLTIGRPGSSAQLNLE